MFASTAVRHIISPCCTTSSPRWGLPCNKEKCVQKLWLEFFWNGFSAQGMSPDPNEIEALQQADPPTNVLESHSLLGLASYRSRLRLDYAAIGQVLRTLTQKNIPWQWGPEQDQTVQKWKDQLSSITVLCYVAPELKTKLIINASL